MGDRYCKLCLTFTLYSARCEILLKWRSEGSSPRTTPGSGQWPWCCPYTGWLMRVDNVRVSSTRYLRGLMHLTPPPEYSVWSHLWGTAPPPPLASPLPLHSLPPSQSYSIDFNGDTANKKNKNKKKHVMHLTHFAFFNLPNLPNNRLAKKKSLKKAKQF